MHKTMIVTLAALAGLLLLPLPGSARESRHQGVQPQGSYSHRSASPGSFQRGVQPRSFSSPRSFTRQGAREGVHRDGYRGSYPRSVFRSGGHYSGGHYYGGHRYYGSYPRYRSNVYFSGDVWLGPGWYAGWGWPYYYPYSYPYYDPYYSPYYYSPPVVIEQPPTEYIQKDQQPEETHYWYYCRNPEGYYPTVQRCPDGWTKEPASSPPPADQEGE
ncbi:MAG: hypothetical protein WCA04_15915 [Geobacteraceae bacterium]